MSYHILVGATLLDDAMYEEYRTHMKPLLHDMGGEFLLDYQVTATGQGSAGQDYDRLFVIRFPDEATKTAFFAADDYQRIRNKWFSPSVKDIAILAAWET